MKKSILTMAVTGLLLIPVTQVLALNTAANTPISNTATVGYSVNAEPQADVYSNNNVATTFLVDRKIRPVVTNLSNDSLTPNLTGSEAHWLKFTVKNEGNSTQNFTLSFEATGSTLSTDLTGVIIVAAADATTYTVADDGNTNLNGTAVSFAKDETKTYFIVAPDTAADLIDGQVVTYHLIATTDLSEASATNTAAVDNVFADGAGTATSDDAYEGFHSGSGIFTVSSATLTVTKSEVADDGIGGDFHIPGATITYTINIDNSGGTAATSIVLTDPIPTNTTYTEFTTCTGTKNWFDSSVAVNAWVAAEPTTKTDVTQIKCSIATLAATSAVDVVFKVVIQ